LNRNKPGRRTLSFQNPYQTIGSTILINDTATGSSVKDWRNRLAHGRDASTPYSRTSRKVRVLSSGNWKTYAQWRQNSVSQWWPYSTSGNGHVTFNSVAPDISVPSSVENKARSKFVSAMRDTRQAMDGTTFLAEIHKTLHQMRHPLSSLRSGISDYLTLANKRGLAALTTGTLRRGNGLASRSNRRQSGSRNTVRRRALMDALTGTYLEWKFGVQPTLLDLQDANRALLRQSGHLLTRTEIHGRAEWNQQIPDSAVYEDSNWVLSGLLVPLGPTSNGRITARRKVEIKGKVSFTACVGYPEHEPSLSREFGFTPENFIPSLWELFPWSWALDYALNVDDYLSAYTASYADILWVNRAVTTLVTETWVDCGISGLPASSANFQQLGSLVVSPSIVEIETQTYARAPIEATAANFSPVFHFSVPSAVQMLNLASAVWQARKVSENLNNRLRL